MRITESQLRRVIRDVIRESYEDGNPGDIASHEYYPDMGMKQSDAGYQVSGGDGDPLAAELDRIEAMGDQVQTGRISHEISRAIKSIRQMLGLEKSGIRHVD